MQAGTRRRVEDPLVAMTPPPRSAIHSSHSLPRIPTRPAGTASETPRTSAMGTAIAANPGRSRPPGVAVLESLARKHGPESIPAGMASEAAGRRRAVDSRPMTDRALDEVATRSPLLALEIALSQAKSGDEKVAACFNALRGLREAISRPLQPLLEAVSKEMWMSAIAVGGSAAASGEERLRAVVAERDAEIARLRSELESSRDEIGRLSGENALLLRERQNMLEQAPALGRRLPLPLPPRMVAPAPAPAPAPSLGASSASPQASPQASPPPHGAGQLERDGGLAFAKLTTQLSGRNVFDRVEDAAHKMRAPKQEVHRARVREKADRNQTLHDSLGPLVEVVEESVEEAPPIGERPSDGDEALEDERLGDGDEALEDDELEEDDHDGDITSA